jgi:formylmethanofuran dehydrogenase subunit B
MINKLNNADIASLKKVIKVTPDYEFFSELFLALIGNAPDKTINASGVTVISHWKATKRLLLNNFMKNAKAF